MSVQRNMVKLSCRLETTTYLMELLLITWIMVLLITWIMVQLMTI